jgi:MSHA type pilus biogenesis protein MshL
LLKKLALISFLPAKYVTYFFKAKSRILKVHKNLLKTYSIKFTLLICLGAVFSCSHGKINSFDDNSGLSRSEIEKALIRDKSFKKDKKKKDKNSKSENIESPIPSVSNLVIAPPPPVIGGEKIISFSTTDQVPLKDILIELGRLADIDIDLDPTISGGIIINAKNRPLKEIIDRIATLGNLRYSYKNGTLFFERDTPYMKNYFVDYLIAGTLWTDVESNISSIISSAASQNAEAAASAPSSSTSNKSAGIISIFANQKQHSEVSKYLKDVEKHASAQVLIEAKIVEVTLSKDFASGIDWSWVGKDNTVTTSGSFGVGEFSSPSLEATIPNIKLLGLNGSINATIRALERFGNAKAISSPRITAMNNQNATLDFSETLIYFTIETSASTVAGTSNPTTVASVTATKNEIPIGVQLSITPSINVKTNEITLDIKPTLSVDSGRDAIDPSVNPQTGESLGNTIPIVKTRSLKTLAKVQSGSVLVIGGLMSDTTSDVETGVPFLSRVPVLGHLFKFISKSTQVVETVIFIKATIVDSGGLVGREDRELQENFDVNKRSFF